MSTPSQPITTATHFKRQAQAIATELLASWVGEDRACEAIGRISVALTASVAAARDPRDFYECTPASIASCIAYAALTGIMPGRGSTALAYVVPQRARKGEAPQLDYQLSHRGINALARRCGQTMIAIPIGVSDKIRANAEAEVEAVSIDLDNPPETWDELRGVMLIVKEIRAGQLIHRGWVPKKIIERRRAMSRSAKSEYSPWHNWPVEMAMKTAMHYAIGRGWCIIDDTEAARALNADVEAELPDRVEDQAPPVGPANLRNGAKSAGASPAAPPARTPPDRANPAAESQESPATGPGGGTSNPPPDSDAGEPPAGAEPEGQDRDEDYARAVREFRADMEPRILDAASQPQLESLLPELRRAKEWLGEEVYQIMMDLWNQRQRVLAPKPARAAKGGRSF